MSEEQKPQFTFNQIMSEFVASPHPSLISDGEVIDAVLAHVAEKTKAIEERERKLDNEKATRVLYQDIVYKLCNLADRFAGRTPGNGVTIHAVVADIENQLCKAFGRICELEVERDEAKKLIEETYCAYCGERFPLSDNGTPDLVGAHIATCHKHPMRAVERQRDALKAAAGEAWTEIGHWIQLAMYQRDQMDTNLGWCPTQAGIEQSQAVRERIGRAAAAHSSSA